MWFLLDTSSRDLGLMLKVRQGGQDRFNLNVVSEFWRVG